MADRGGAIDAAGIVAIVPGGQGNVANHDAPDAGGDRLAKGQTGDAVPLLARQGIRRGHRVLVQIIHAITGEMLGAGGQPMLLHATRDRLREVSHASRIVAERAGISDRIIRIDVYVNHRRKGPMNSGVAPFAGRGGAKRVRQRCIIGRGHG